MSDRKEGWCPSNRPDWPGAHVMGVVVGTPERPEVEYFSELEPLTLEVLRSAEPYRPMEIFRFATPCQKEKCGFWANGCTVAPRVVAKKAATATEIPRCPIRSQCQWYREQGREICFRCPQVVSEVIVGDPKAEHEIHFT